MGLPSIVFRSALLLVPLLAVSLAVHNHARAEGGGISVAGAWVRAIPPVVKNTAGYLILNNHGKRADRLVGVSAKFARVVEIHNVLKKDGMVEMGPVESVTIPAGGKAALEPGGYHLMIIGLKQVPKAGERVELVLKFEHAGSLAITAVVREGAPMAHGAGMKGMPGTQPMKMKR